MVDCSSKAATQKREGFASPEKVAEFMAVSRSLIYTMMADGRMPYAKVGRLRRVRWSDVEAFMEEQTVDTTPAA